MIPPLLIHRFSHDATAAGEAATGENLQLLTHARGGRDEGAAPRRRGNLSNRDYSNEEGEEEEEGEGADDNSLDRIAVAKQF